MIKTCIVIARILFFSLQGFLAIIYFCRFLWIYLYPFLITKTIIFDRMFLYFPSNQLKSPLGIYNETKQIHTDKHTRWGGEDSPLKNIKFRKETEFLPQPQIVWPNIFATWWWKYLIFKNFRLFKRTELIFWNIICPRHWNENA